MNLTTEHESKRNGKMVNKTEVLEVIKKHFDDALIGVKLRSESEQTIIGNFLTSLELELKKDIKSLKEHEAEKV